MWMDILTFVINIWSFITQLLIGWMLIVLSFVVFRIKHQPCPLCFVFFYFTICVKKGLKQWTDPEYTKINTMQSTVICQAIGHSPFPMICLKSNSFYQHQFVFLLIFILVHTNYWGYVTGEEMCNNLKIISTKPITLIDFDWSAVFITERYLLSYLLM